MLTWKMDVTEMLADDSRTMPTILEAYVPDLISNADLNGADLLLVDFRKWCN